MVEQVRSQPTTATSARRPRRLYPSTVVVGLVAVVALGLAMVPGDRRFTGIDPGAVEFTQIDHGWPLIYLTRRIENPGETSDAAQIWSLTGSVRGFHVPALLLDLLLATSALAAIVLGYQYWRRQRGRIWQLHLSDVLAIVLLSAGVFAAYHRLDVTHRNQKLACERLKTLAYGADDPEQLQVVGSPRYFSVATEPRLPDWLAALYDGGDFNIFDTVVGLNLAAEKFDDDSLAELANFPDVEALVLSPKVTDSGISRLSKLSRLRMLDVPYQVSDAGLASICGLAMLEQLRLDATRVSDDGLAHLKQLRNLRRVSLPDEITNAGLVHLSHLSNLEVLDLSCTRVTDDGLANIEPLAQLERLILPPMITDAGFEHVMKLRHLQHIEMHYSTALTDVGLAYVGELLQLKELNLAEFRVTDAGLAHMRNMEQLERLNLSGTGITDAGLAHLTGMRTLCALDLSGTAVTSAGLAHLARLEKLEELRLAESRVDDAGLARLVDLKELHTLNLRATDVDDAGLDYVAQLKRLVDLDLSGTNVTDEGIARLKALKRLERLALFDTKVTSRAAASLMAALPALDEKNVTALVGDLGEAPADEKLPPGVAAAPGLSERPADSTTGPSTVAP